MVSPTLRVGRGREPEPRRPKPQARLTIDQLAERTGLTPRTIRSYQTQGILPAPEHRGRMAYYDDSHLERLALVSQLKDEGLTLSGIQHAIRRREAARRAPPEPTPRTEEAPAVAPSIGVPRLQESPSTAAYRPVVDASPTAVGERGPASDRRKVRLVTVLVSWLALAALAAGSVILLLTDAAADRDELAREISGLRQELARLGREQGSPTTVVVPSGTPPPAAPPAPPPPTTAAADPAATTRVITSPGPSPPATVVMAPSPPPPPPTCTTLPILNRCL